MKQALHDFGTGVALTAAIILGLALLVAPIVLAFKFLSVETGILSVVLYIGGLVGALAMAAERNGWHPGPGYMPPPPPPPPLYEDKP